MKTLVPACLLLCGLVVSARADAGTITRWFSVSPYATDISQGSSGGPGASYGSGFSAGRGLAGIQMPDPAGGLSKFSFGFTLPDDYAPGTALHLRVVWRSDAIDCNIDLRSNFLQWLQPGSPNRSGSINRLSPLAAPADNTVSNETLFLLNFVPMPAFEGGDAFAGGLFRTATNDTCADTFYIQGMSIIYQALTASVFKDGFETVS